VTSAPRPLSLRREAPIVLPLALLLFAVLAGVTLAFYRAGVARLADERAAEALALAERLLEEAPHPAPARLELWRARLPPGAALALVDRHGQLLALAGAVEGALSPDLVVSALADGRATAGPAQLGGPQVVALVRLAEPDEAALLRLDLPAAALAGEQRALAVLTPLVAGLAAATAFVVILFFRAALRPYEALLERARAAAGAEESAARDELDFLLATFDRALAVIGTPGGDLEPLAGTLGHSLDGGFLLLDPDRRVLVTTPAAAELLAQASPAAGTPLAEAFAGAPEVARAIAAGLAESGGSAFHTLRLPGGSEGDRVLGFTAEPLRGEGGRLRGWLVVLADRTESERESARERLAEGLAQLGELAAGVAHELRNGLAALGGWLALARRRPQAPETAECLDEMARESAQLERVVDEFLAFARPGTRRLERCDLAEIARRAAADPLFSPPGTRLALPEPGAALLGDPGLLERAVRNLISNAVAAEREAGRAEPVEIAVARDATGWHVTVEDRGRGVPAELGDALFEPFVSGRAGGVGLGLALVRRIALLHRGAIRCLAREGGGSRFVLDLPDLAIGNIDT